MATAPKKKPAPKKPPVKKAARPAPKDSGSKAKTPSTGSKNSPEGTRPTSSAPKNSSSASAGERRDVIGSEPVNNSDGAAEVVREAVAHYEAGTVRETASRYKSEVAAKKAARRDVVGDKPVSEGDSRRGAADSNSNGSAEADTVRSFVQRLERIDTEIAELRDDRKEILAEAKEAGVNVKAAEKLVRERMESEERRKKAAALEDMIEQYRLWVSS
jgi:uncharacterized protein (UPF0335 family)